MDNFVSITDKPIFVYFFPVTYYLFIFFYVKWNVSKRLTRNIRSPVNVLSLSRKKKKMYSLAASPQQSGQAGVISNQQQRLGCGRSILLRDRTGLGDEAHKSNDASRVEASNTASASLH